MKKALKIIRQEIDFHEKIKGEGEFPSEAFKNGFIRGLKHIHFLLLVFRLVRRADRGK